MAAPENRAIYSDAKLKSVRNLKVDFGEVVQEPR